MARRLLKDHINYFANPLKEGQYKVLPPKEVPSHIIKPSYVNSSSPIYGIYQGTPVLHGAEAIQKLIVAGRIASKTLEQTREFIQERGRGNIPLTQEQIDVFVFKSIVAQNAYPTPIGFMNFPKSVCVSVNECFVHGIPSIRTLEKGDKLNIDVSIYFDGYHGDNNLTVFYGTPSHPIKQTVVDVTQEALYAAISVCGPGVPFREIGKTIQNIATKSRLNVCPHFMGHGIGELLHMPPPVIHFDYPQFPDRMKPGNVFTIEPIITLYPVGEKFQLWKDNFTAISHNNPNAQFEHTILIRENGCEILTRRPSETIPNPRGNILL